MRIVSDFITDKSAPKGSVCKSILSFLSTGLFFSPVVFLKVGKIYKTANRKLSLSGELFFYSGEELLKNMSLVSLPKSEDQLKYF